jgi:hypothetical protein
MSLLIVLSLIVVTLVLLLRGKEMSDRCPYCGGLDRGPNHVMKHIMNGHKKGSRYYESNRSSQEVLRRQDPAV